MPVRIQIASFTDHRDRRQLERGRVLAQDTTDLSIYLEWQRRIAENVQRRRAAKATRIAAEFAEGKSEHQRETTCSS